MEETRNKKLDLLRSIGTDEWFLCSEKYKRFLDWFCTHVTDDMLHTETELRLYRDLLDEQQQQQGTGGAVILTAEQLEREAHSGEFAADLADTELSDAVHEQLRAEIALYESIDAELARLIEDTKKTNSKTVQQLTATQLQRQRLAADEERLAAECLAAAHSAQTAQLDNQRRIRELNRFYAADQPTPVFVHQMGMHSYYQQCDAFGKCLDQYMQNNFRLLLQLQQHNDTAATAGGVGGDQQPLDESCGSDTAVDPDAVAQLERINYKLYKSSIELAREQMNWAAYQRLHHSDALDKWQLPGGGRRPLAAATEELRQLNEGHMAAELEGALDALTFVLRQLAGLRVEAAAYENTRGKLRRAEQRLAGLRQVQQVMAAQLLNAEVLWLLMQFDVERLRGRGLSGAVEAYAAEEAGVARRTERMRECAAEGAARAAALGEWFEASVQRAIGEHAPQFVRMVGGGSGGGGAYERLLQAVSNGLRALSAPQLQWPVAERLKEIAQQEALYGAFVRDSPKAQLVLYDLPTKNRLHAIRVLVAEIEEQIGEFKTNYINEYTMPMNNNKFMQAKRLLWIYYLTDPKTVLRVIKSIKLAAKATAGQAPPPAIVAAAAKSISGIMRKN